MLPSALPLSLDLRSRLVDLCLEAGLTMFDSADMYSSGLAEEVLGVAIKGRREQVLISTKATFRVGPGPNDVGSSRHHLIKACEAMMVATVARTMSGSSSTRGASR